ncbi:hypothetical protein Tco_1034214 [Tanacetum coccineum]
MMKNDWKSYNHLMRIESGLGWDPVRKTIDATPEWTQLPIEFQNNDSPSNIQEEPGATNIEGNRDSDEFNSSDGVEISFPESSLTKKKKDNNSNTRSKKGETIGVSSSFELKLDIVLQTLSSRSSQTFPSQNHVRTVAECMDIVATFLSFEPSSTHYDKALRIF